jgi:hypothetical protein
MGRSYSIGVFENRQFCDDNASYNNESDQEGQKGTINIERSQQFGIFTTNIEQFRSMVF